MFVRRREIIRTTQKVMPSQTSFVVMLSHKIYNFNQYDSEDGEIFKEKGVEVQVAGRIMTPRRNG